MKKAILILSLVAGFISCQNGNVKNQSGSLEGDLIVFHAGSLSVPMKLIAQDFEKENPGVHILLEAAGSVACARKITDLKKDCDIMASADYEVIDRFLIPDYADWNISFASNEMIIAFNDQSKLGDQITGENWYEILNNPNTIYGRSDPNSDPCGYRSVMTTQLEALKDKDPAILKLLDKDQNFIRPKETDLLGLLESNALDYIFIYKSVALQHHLKFVTLSDSVNLSSPKLKDWYAMAKVDIAGNKPGEVVSLEGSPMIYGITILKDAPNPRLAKAFLDFFLNSDQGMKIIEAEGQGNILPSPSAFYDKIPKRLKKYVYKAEE